MTIDQIAAYVESMEGVLTLRPGPDDGTPEVAWGDLFFYYAPDGVLTQGQPFATIVTKDYPGEPSSNLGGWRVPSDYRQWPPGSTGVRGPTVRDEVVLHPVYGPQGWVCVVQPGIQSSDETQVLVRDAYSAARRRWDKRHGSKPSNFPAPECAGNRHTEGMTRFARDFDLSMNELRVVAQFAAQSADDVLILFEEGAAGDLRPLAAVEAAWSFAHGARRTNLQRTTAVAANRAAKGVSDRAANCAALAAGDAAAAAYLHPLAEATQVAHILRASAYAARAAELKEGGDPDVGDTVIEKALHRARPELIDVLNRYPVAPEGNTRTASLMKSLDNALR